uniref:Uncharacterized protein n=1 Tax=Panagrellus redivivus TaxID=6233 RepID=A0A7E4VHR5_PANRE
METLVNSIHKAVVQTDIRDELLKDANYFIYILLVIIGLQTVGLCFLGITVYKQYRSNHTRNRRQLQSHEAGRQNPFLPKQ